MRWIFILPPLLLLSWLPLQATTGSDLTQRLLERVTSRSQPIETRYGGIRAYAEHNNVPELLALAYSMVGVEGVNLEDMFQALLDEASLDNPEAAYAVGFCYEKGVGVTQDYSQALEWYTLVAETNSYPKVLVDIGRLYASGSGLLQSFKRANEYYLQAHDRGVMEGTLNLGIAYIESWGVEPDMIAGRELLTAAAEAEHLASQIALIQYYASKTFTDIDEEEQEALEKEWMWRAADNGSSKANYTLATWDKKKELEETGKTVESDFYYDMLDQAMEGNYARAYGILALQVMKASFNKMYRIVEDNPDADTAFKLDLKQELEKDAQLAHQLAERSYELGNNSAGLLLVSIAHWVGPEPYDYSVRLLNELVKRGSEEAEFILNNIGNGNHRQIVSLIKEARGQSYEDLYVKNIKEIHARQYENTDGPPVVFKMVRPQYPAGLLANEQSDRIVVEFTVTKKGKVIDAKPYRDYHPALIEAGLAAIRQWRFQPGSKDGVPAEFRMRIPLIFTIN